MIKTLKQYQLVLESKEGPQTILVSKKNIKRIIFRYDDSGEQFKVSAPLFTNKRDIRVLFYEKEQQILALKHKKKKASSDNFYYFGHKYNSYHEILELDQQISKEQYEKLLKPQFQHYLEARTRYYEQIMKIPLSHKVRVRAMKTRWGTNAIRTRTLTFNLYLCAYHPHITDAIVIHELAHYFIGGHQKDFYALIHQYCPNYKQLAYNLKRGHYAND